MGAHAPCSLLLHAEDPQCCLTRSDLRDLFQDLCSTPFNDATDRTISQLSELPAKFLGDPWPLFIALLKRDLYLE